MNFQTFKTEKAESGNLIIAELNANVADLTFLKSVKKQLGDLYTSPNECPLIVAHKTCPPVNGTFVKTIGIEF